MSKELKDALQSAGVKLPVRYEHGQINDAKGIIISLDSTRLLTRTNFEEMCNLRFELGNALANLINQSTGE